MQNIEVELKFGVIVGVEELFRILPKLGVMHEVRTDYLKNVYYDTPDKALFSRNAGLRIRSGNDFREQTLKIRGRNIAGLHEREEYSVPLKDSLKKPSLQLFPREALPADLDLKDIDRRLKPLCQINFKRTFCDFEFKDCRFEVSWDVGSISLENGEYPVNEVEIELKETRLERSEVLIVMSNLVTRLADRNLSLTLEPFSKMHRAALLIDNDRNAQHFFTTNPFRDLHTYIIDLLSAFDNLFGLLQIRRDPLILGCMNFTVKTLCRALRELPLSGEVALEGRSRDPVDYEETLDQLRRSLRKFYKLSHDLERKFIAHALEGDDDKLRAYTEEIRAYAQATQAYIVPLKIRVLLSLLIKSGD